MMGICEYCKLRTRINKKTKFCAPCVRNWQEVVEEHFDGNPMMPLEVAMGSMFEIWRGELYVFGREVYRLETNGFDSPEHWTWVVLTAEMADELKSDIELERRAALERAVGEKAVNHD